jgi:tetratricopeptide (TPR) repeat protein
VWSEGEVLSLDHAAIAGRLREARLAPGDWVAEDDGPWRPIAAHPDFRALYLPGHAEALPEEETAAPRALVMPPPSSAPAAPRPTGGPSRAAMLAVPGLVLVAALAGAGWWFSRGAPEAPVEPAAPAPPVAAASVAAPVPVAPPPAPAGALDALAARVGEVEEPRALLVARAWSARFAGDLPAAVTAAERAVVRAPDDPEALGLLAELYVLADREPALAKELRARANEKGPHSAAASRATASIAFAQGRADAALAEAERCLQLAPDDVGCRAVHLAVTESGRDPANLLYAYDALARDWPANRELVRHAALLAARADAAGAEERLAAARKLFRDDAELAHADSRQRLRAGDLDGALALLGSPAADVSPEVALDAAGILVAKGDGAGARAWLDVLPEPGGADARARYRLLALQARILLAEADPARAADVAPAAVALAELGGKGAADLQARVIAARLGGPDVAWAAPDPATEHRRDVARAWMARVALLVEKGRAPDALAAAEEAVKADPSDPAAHLWKARALMVAQNPKGAYDALRAAVARVDGQAARRSGVGGALPVPAPTAWIGDADLNLTTEAGFARRVWTWLHGQTPALDGGAGDPELHALRARVRLQQGDPAGALAEIDRASAAQPREAAWHVVRVQALVALGRWADAERSLETIRSAGVQTPIVHALRAQVAKARKSPAVALDAARAATAADPLDVEARRLLRALD